MLILHAGMHKTGTTAIQHALAGAVDTNFTYAPWHREHHNDLFSILFEDDPNQYRTIANLGLSSEDLSQRRIKAKARLKRATEKSSSSKFVFSAERIMFGNKPSARRLKSFFAKHFSTQNVYIYIRPSVGYIESMFQEHVKKGRSDFVLPWPNYRRSIEKLDMVFGQENVHLRLMRPALLYKNDVVADFMSWADITGTIPRTERRNDRLTASGLAILYVYQKVIKDIPYGLQQAAPERKLTQFLRSVEGPPFAIDRGLLRQQVKRNAADMDWIENRLGSPVLAETDYALPPDPVMFSSETDILEHANATQSILDAFDGQVSGQVPLQERLRMIGEGS